MNQVVLIGRLARDPELRFSQSGTAIGHFTIAVDKPAKYGEDRKADFIRVTCFGKTAETVDRYLRKGSGCAILGRVQTGSYDGKDGNKVYTTDIVAERVEFTSGGQSVVETEKTAQRSKFGHTEPSDIDMPDTFSYAEDDILF